MLCSAALSPAESNLVMSVGYDLYRSRGAELSDRPTASLRIGVPPRFAARLWQLCISPFIHDKYDFTLLFIRLKYK
jgi:hypothetical protein